MTLLQTLPAQSAQQARLPERESEASREVLTRIMKAGAAAHDGAPDASAGWMAVGRVSAFDVDIGADPASNPGSSSGSSSSPGEWRVTLPSGARLAASVALSCVLRPQRDDLVQLYVDNGRCWVLAILERRASASAPAPALTLDFGAAHVVLKAHGVHVQARDSVTLETAQFAARADVITQAAAERQAHISGTDATHAGCTLVHTERHMGLHANSAAVTASSLLKIDAGQIHMG